MALRHRAVAPASRWRPTKARCARWASSGPRSPRATASPTTYRARSEAARTTGASAARLACAWSGDGCIWQFYGVACPMLVVQASSRWISAVTQQASARFLLSPTRTHDLDGFARLRREHLPALEVG